MAGELVRPSALPSNDTPNATDEVVSDDGVTVSSVTWAKGVAAGRPLASQAEAEAGVQATKAMTPLTTKQAVTARIGVDLASKAQGDKADTAVQPGDLAGVATSGDYNDLTNKPTLGDLAVKDKAAIADIDATGTASSSTYLRGDGAWSSVSATIADGNKGDITVSGTGSAWALNAGAATLAKIGDDAKADFRFVDPNGPRIPVGYYNATQCQIVGIRSIAMGGFRSKGGRYKIGRAPVFDMPAFTDAERHIIDAGNGTSTAGDLFAEAYHAKSCWYANFAAANDGDATATLGMMPFLRVGSISGNSVILNISFENDRTVSPKTHQFTTNGLVGADVLVITETLNNRPNAFSYRMAKVTSNTQNVVTLDDVGTMGEFDYFLVAPPGWDHYCYLNTIPMDTSEFRNIADSGQIVATTGVENTQADISGAITTSVKMPFDGHISPLANAVVFVHGDTVSGAHDGDLVSRWGTDGSSHRTLEYYTRRVAATSAAYTFTFPPGAFSFGQQLYCYSGGTLNSVTSRHVYIRGWVEQ